MLFSQITLFFRSQPCAVILEMEVEVRFVIDVARFEN